MNISVIICTYNRARYLAKALESLRTQTLSHPFEVVVVDNNCTDATPQVVEEYMKKGLNITFVKEQKQGLSHARNKGFKTAAFPIVVYLDDDAMACREWLEAVAANYSDVSNEHLVLGGKIEVIWEQERPEWLGDDLLVWLGKLDLGSRRTLQFPEEHVNGGNLAARKSTLEAVGGFDPTLGIQGKKMFTNEEIELQNRVVQLGGEIVYDPSMTIYHHARLNLTPKWFLDRSFRHGASIYRTEGRKNSSMPKDNKRLFHVLKTISKLSLKKKLGRMSEDQFMKEMVPLYYEYGYRKESFFD